MPVRKWLRELDTNFHSEREVETKFILTLATHLGYGPSLHAVGYTIPGSRQQADVVLFACEEHVPGTSLVVWEAKKPDNPEDPLPQARRYAAAMGTPFYATCNGEHLAVYRLSDHAQVFAVSSLAQLEERWGDLERLLHRRILVDQYPEKQRQPFTAEQAHRYEQAYRQGVRERHGQLQVFGRQAAVNLRSIYVPTRLAPVPERLAALEGDTAEKGPLAKQNLEMRRLVLSPEAKPAEEVLQRERRLVVIGDPGAGKTTMMLHFALALADRRLQGLEPATPVYTSLNQLFKDRRADDPLPIEEYFFAHFEQSAGRMEIPRGDLWLQEWLKAGRVVLLWDGLDEVTGFGFSQEGDPQAPHQAITLIRNLAERYPDARMVVTARRGAWQHRSGNLPPDFAVYETLPFQPDDIERFVRSWFDQDSDGADQLLEALRSNPVAYRLATTPLLLAFMAYQYERTGELPDWDRYTIFDRCVSLLLRDWDRYPERQVHRRPILNEKQTRWLLGDLSLTLHERRTRYASRRELQHLVEGFLERSPRGNPDQAADVIDQDLESKYGLIRQFTPDNYGLIHLSLQEFLAAEAIERRWEEWWRDRRLLEHAGDSWWEEVFVHLAGGSHSQELIAALLQGTDDIFHTRLFLAGRCLAGAGSAQVAPPVRAEVVRQLAAVVRHPEDPERERAVDVLGEIGTAEAVSSLVQLAARADLGFAVRVGILSTLARLRYPEIAAVASRVWDETGHFPWTLGQVAGPAEAARIIERARAELARGRYEEGIFLLISLRSLEARRLLYPLLADVDEPLVLRLAAAWALAAEDPAALHLCEEHWGSPELEPIVRSVGFLADWSGRMLARTDPAKTALPYLELISQDLEIPGLRLDLADTAPFAERATAVLKGRFSRRQALVVWILAAMGDEMARTYCRRWLGQRRRGELAAAVLAAYWPEDLLGYAGPLDLEPHQIRRLARKSSGEPAGQSVATQLLRKWRQQGAFAGRPESQGVLLFELAVTGDPEAVEAYCQLARNHGLIGLHASGGAINEAFVTRLLETKCGRELVESALTSPPKIPQFLPLMAAVAEVDEELARRGLSNLISLIPKGKRTREMAWDILKSLSRKLNLFFYWDEKRRLAYREG